MKTREFNLPDVQIPRNVPTAMYGFEEFFKGFERVPAVRELFGRKTVRILAELKVEFLAIPTKFGYMEVASDEDGIHLLASAHYMMDGELVSKYLDVVHELVHVKQFREGRRLFDGNGGILRAMEREANEHAVKEAKMLGMSDEQIFEYLKVIWMSKDKVRKLALSLGVKPPRAHRKERTR